MTQRLEADGGAGGRPPTRVYRRPRFGVWANADAAAVFAAFDAFGLVNVLLAADAAFGLVCLVFRPISLTSSRLLACGTRR